MFTTACLLAACCGVHADDLVWDGSTGNWDTDTSWLPGGVEPTSADNVAINSGSVTLDLIGEVARNLAVGQTSGSNGTLSIEAGGAVTNSTGYIGHFGGSAGTATVTGTGSSWVNTNSLYVGFSGTGTLSIEDGGQLTGRGYVGISGLGSVTVTGAGSTWTNPSSLLLASSGNATMTIQDGGAVTNTQAFLASLNSAAQASATITGSGST